MSSILIIGTGGVGAVVAKKCYKDNTFNQICLANRSLNKALAIKKSIGDNNIQCEQVDADNAQEVITLIKKHKPQLVINTALPYQDLSIMDACLECKVDYLDTANYEPKDVAKFEYHWQWAYQQRFKDAGIMALLGSGFDPGVTNVFIAYARKHYFDTIYKIDIMDCNGGDHGQVFATNFNPEINIREITQKGRYWKNGHWIETPPLSEHHSFDFPEVGKREMYLMYHEEMESLTKHFPEIKEMRFYMTFSQEYLTHLRVLQNLGLTSIKPINYKGLNIIPLEFLKALLPEPSSLGATTVGKTCIGCIIEGIKDNKPKKIYIYNICDHQKCFTELGSQAISYTTGVPAMIGAKLILQKIWHQSGVLNMEQLDPDPFMEELNKNGLPWIVKEL